MLERLKAARLLGGAREAARARTLYFEIAAHARDPAFYRELGVPDTFDGRFDALVLHMALVFRRLHGETGAGPLTDALFEVMLADLDRSVREAGTSDTGVGKRVRQMARAFYGRADAYGKALGVNVEGEALSGRSTTQAVERLEAALARNLYGGTVAADSAAVGRMADNVRAAVAALEGQSLADFRAGRPGLPAPLTRHEGGLR